MGVKEKYALYNMLYAVAAKRAIQRGRAKFVNPWSLHRAAMNQTIYILNAIGESVTEDELFSAICQEVSVA